MCPSAEPDTRLPVAILGGFMSYPGLYQTMRRTLQQITGQPVTVADVWPRHWVRVGSPAGWPAILERLERAVQQALEGADGGRLILVGHSAGGVLSRLYLSPQPFLGRRYPGGQRVAALVTLGSPHYVRRESRRGGVMSQWVEQRYPGAAFAPAVRYVAVAGKFVRGDPAGSLQARFAWNIYGELCGRGDAWGDGLIPVESALLVGARHVVLDGVRHQAIFRQSWYGSPEVIRQWWEG